jgi:hypothetical protein
MGIDFSVKTMCPGWGKQDDLKTGEFEDYRGPDKKTELFL